jgi:hypothetical protein
MKFSFKIGFLLLFIAFAVVSCQSDEAFVTQEDGLWNVTLRTTKIFENDVLTKDTTETDSLGQFEFLAGGGGYRFDKKGTRENIQWVVDSKDQQITIYGSTEFINGTISNRTKSSLTIDWTEEQGVGQPVVYRYERSMKLQR